MSGTSYLVSSHAMCTVPHGLPWPISLQACPHIERNLDFVSNNGGWSVDYRRMYDLTALCRIISTHKGILREKHRDELVVFS